MGTGSEVWGAAPAQSHRFPGPTSWWGSWCYCTRRGAVAQRKSPRRVNFVAALQQYTLVAEALRNTAPCQYQSWCGRKCRNTAPHWRQPPQKPSQTTSRQPLLSV